MANNNGSSIGVDIFTVVAIVFIILKCLGIITWSWFWVLAPIWIPLAILVILVTLFVVFGTIFK